MKYEEQIILEILKIYPLDTKAKGYIFFGSLEDKPPYEMSTYHSSRLTLNDRDDTTYRKAFLPICGLLDSLLENVTIASPIPHGFIRVQNSQATLHWTTKDIVDTMLDNIDKVSKLDHYR